MKTQCPHCKAGFEVRDSYSGKNAKCPKCKQVFVVTAYTLPKPTSVSPKVPNIPDDDIPDEEPRLTAEDYDRKIKLLKRDERGKQQQARAEGLTYFIQVIMEIFLFRRMIFPWLIIVFFAIAFLFALIYPLFDFIPGSQPESVNSLDAFSYDPPMIFLILEHEWVLIWIGLLWLRIVSEWMILFFRIHQDTRIIAGAIKDQSENKLQKASA